MELLDVREYVFLIHIGTYPRHLNAGGFVIDKDGYLGTGFFIAKNGLGMTAAHCLPEPDSIEDKSVCAGVWDGKFLRAHKILSFIKWPKFDIAVIEVENVTPKYLRLSFESLSLGADVFTIGIPLHSLRGEGLEVRLLKGHVVSGDRFLELSFAAPRGMSGSPLFRGDEVVGVISGNARSESLEDQVEEIVELTDQKELIRIIETKSVINYGLAEQLTPLRDARHKVFGDHTFQQLIDHVNTRNERAS